MLTEVTSIDKAGFQRIHFTVRIIFMICPGALVSGHCCQPPTHARDRGRSTEKIVFSENGENDLFWL